MLLKIEEEKQNGNKMNIPKLIMCFLKNDSNI